jgi:hypothetical protein
MLSESSVKRGISKKLKSIKGLYGEFFELMKAATVNVDDEFRDLVKIYVNELHERIALGVKLLKNKENSLLDLKLEVVEHLIRSWIPSVENEVLSELKSKKARDVVDKMKKESFEMLKLFE